MAAVMILIGGGLFGVGGWFAFDHASLLANRQRSVGTVTEVVAKRSAKGMTLYRPVVTYTEPGSTRSQIFREKTGLWPSPFAEGDEVEVVFDPAVPESARFVSFWTLWFLPARMIAVSLLAVALGWARIARGS